MGTRVTDDARPAIDKAPGEILQDVRRAVDAAMTEARAKLPEARHAVIEASAATALAAERERAFEARIAILLTRLVNTGGKLSPLIGTERSAIGSAARRAWAKLEEAQATVTGLENELRAIEEADDQLKYLHIF